MSRHDPTVARWRQPPFAALHSVSVHCHTRERPASPTKGLRQQRHRTAAHGRGLAGTAPRGLTSRTRRIDLVNETSRSLTVASHTGCLGAPLVPRALPNSSVLDQGTALRAVRGGKPPPAAGTPPRHEPQQGRDGSRRGWPGRVVGASGCRASPTPGLACHRGTGARHHLHRRDVPGPIPHAARRRRGASRDRAPASHRRGVLTDRGVKESWAVSGPSGPSPGRQTPQR